MNMKKNEGAIHFFLLSIFLLSVFYILFTDELEGFVEASIVGVNYHEENSPVKKQIKGLYKVSIDKNSYLSLSDEDNYELSINVCNGYVKIEGKYEMVNNKLKLINTSQNEEYNTLKDNSEFSFIVVNNDTIMLNENLECLVQGTLFER